MAPTTPPSTSDRLRKPLFWPLLGALLAALGLVLFRVDLTPQVESDFFFSSDDPQLQASQAIDELFPSDPQILIAATGEDVTSTDYVERIQALSDALVEVEGVTSVWSLTHGPSSPQAVAASPIWSRLLLGANPRLSQLVVSISGEAGRAPVLAIEGLLAEHHSPSFALEASGVPWVVELIRRNLSRDLRVFSLASLLVFGLIIALVYRSWRIVAGTLATCLGACAATLALLHLLDKPIGLLTANIVTIVFVLTLSHIVFLTANHELATGANPESEAVRTTFPASFWCMTTTFLGFSSLLLASAQPLRELGFAGALGTLVAMVCAFGFYPTFLGGSAKHAEKAAVRPFPWRPNWGFPLAVAALTVVAAAVLPRLDTDPNLLSYFAQDDPIRDGLVQVDRNGGSSPLLFVVEDAADGRFDDNEVLDRLTTVQESLDDDASVGSSLSLAVLMAEARRAPLAALLPPSSLIDVMASPAFDNVADSFVSADRQKALLFLRMRETERHESRGTTIERLTHGLRTEGFDVELTGGLFHLQRELGALVTRSLLSGLGGLLLLFVPIAALASRGLQPTIAMLVALVPVPVLLLGAFALGAQPVDVITSPAANVAIALGIDSMIHLVSAVRRRRLEGDDGGLAWQSAVDRLWPAIAGALAILAAGFGIFALSSFPPTQRFGLAVAFGTLCAATMALLVLPRLALDGTARQ